jgi:diaminopimelate epimerase
LSDSGNDLLAEKERLYNRMTNSTHPFRKMNGLGNDFAVLDSRVSGFRLSTQDARQIADRVHGVGCDQVIVIEPSRRGDAFMRILNADGTEVNACGNATRCVAALLSGERGSERVTIETGAGLLECTVRADGSVTADMGKPLLLWNEIPLAHSFDDTTTLDVSFDAGTAGLLSDPGAVNVGNPHCVFVVDDIERYDLGAVGPRIEHDPLFPERVNVSLAQLTATDEIRLAVWERGVGLTLACGTAACAAAVAVIRKGLTGRRVSVDLPGGNLQVEWRASDDHILMTGPWQLDYEGDFEFGRPALAS